MTLFRDEKVKWAGEEVGGIRVSHLSHIDKQLKVALRESEQKSVLHTIDPLPDAAPAAPQRPRAHRRAGRRLHRRGRAEGHVAHVSAPSGARRSSSAWPTSRTSRGPRHERRPDRRRA